MGFNVNSLQKNRSDRLTKLSQQFTKEESKSFKDPRYYVLEADKDGKGEVIMRFLPELDDGEPVYVRLYSHSFQEGERWYIENSLTTMDQKDPCAEHFWKIRNDKSVDKETAKKNSQKFGRKTYYIANVMIIDDPKHPENNGKVFLYKFGQTVYQMIKDKAEPQFEGEVPMDIFDPFEGCNFHLRFFKDKAKGGQRSYAKCSWDEPSPLAPTPKALAALLEGQGYPLNAEIAPDKFKTYDELKAKFNEVMGWDAPSPSEKQDGGETQKAKRQPVRQAATVAEEDNSDTPPWEETTKPAARTTQARPVPAAASSQLQEFADLANDDE